MRINCRACHLGVLVFKSETIRLIRVLPDNGGLAGITAKINAGSVGVMHFNKSEAIIFIHGR